MPPSPFELYFGAGSSVLAGLPTSKKSIIRLKREHDCVVGTTIPTNAILNFEFRISDRKNLISSERYSNQFKADHVQEKSKFKVLNIEAEQVAELQVEIAALKRELTALKQEKADLEILLETTAEHSDAVEAELHNTAIAALKQSEEMFRTIASATPAPVLISRLEDCAILYANSAASTTFRIPSEEFLNYSTLDLYHNPSDRQKLLEVIECDGCVQNFELQCKRADGTLFWVAASLRQLTFNDEPAFLTALCDITQRKQEEESLKRQVLELQIEVDHAKRARQVSDIVQSDYFQQIQAEVERLRYPDDDFGF